MVKNVQNSVYVVVEWPQRSLCGETVFKNWNWKVMKEITGIKVELSNFSSLTLWEPFSSFGSLG